MFSKTVISFGRADIDKEPAGTKPADLASAIDYARKDVPFERDLL
jgi:hypothetical protein